MAARIANNNKSQVSDKAELTEYTSPQDRQTKFGDSGCYAYGLWAMWLP
jgi:hypothetical protein